MRRVLILVLLVMSGPFPAEAVQPNPFHLIFSNGMRNTVQDAQYSVQQLKIKVLEFRKKTEEKKLSSHHMLWKEENTSLAYNFDDTTAREIHEVYRQKKQESDRLFWKWYYQNAEATEEFKKLVYEEMSQCRLEHRIDETLLQQRDVYMRALKDNFDLLVVAHSQGNLFANALHQRIKLDEPELIKRIHIVAVATPASEVAGAGPYFTLKSDGVINQLLPMLLDDGLSPPLSANIENQSPKPGLFDHEFLKHYLFGAPSGEKILDAVLDHLLARAIQSKGR